MQVDSDSTPRAVAPGKNRTLALPTKKSLLPSGTVWFQCLTVAGAKGKPCNKRGSTNRPIGKCAVWLACEMDSCHRSESGCSTLAETRASLRDVIPVKERREAPSRKRLLPPRWPRPAPGLSHIYITSRRLSGPWWVELVTHALPLFSLFVNALVSSSLPYLIFIC